MDCLKVHANNPESLEKKRDKLLVSIRRKQNTQRMLLFREEIHHKLEHISEKQSLQEIEEALAKANKGHLTPLTNCLKVYAMHVTSQHLKQILSHLFANLNRDSLEGLSRLSKNPDLSAHLEDSKLSILLRKTQSLHKEWEEANSLQSLQSLDLIYMTLVDVSPRLSSKKYYQLVEYISTKEDIEFTKPLIRLYYALRNNNHTIIRTFLLNRLVTERLKAGQPNDIHVRIIEILRITIQYKEVNVSLIYLILDAIQDIFYSGQYCSDVELLASMMLREFVEVYKGSVIDALVKHPLLMTIIKMANTGSVRDRAMKMICTVLVHSSQKNLDVLLMTDIPQLVSEDANNDNFVTICNILEAVFWIGQHGRMDHLLKVRIDQKLLRLQEHELQGVFCAVERIIDEFLRNYFFQDRV